MKISDSEFVQAVANLGTTETRILPESKPRRAGATKSDSAKQMSPLERGMLVAEEALADVPDTRDELVEELKERIQKGEYQVSGAEIAEMMLRRLAADKIR